MCTAVYHSLLSCVVVACCCCCHCCRPSVCTAVYHSLLLCVVVACCCRCHCCCPSVCTAVYHSLLSCVVVVCCCRCHCCCPSVCTAVYHSLLQCVVVACCCCCHCCCPSVCTHVYTARVSIRKGRLFKNLFGVDRSLTGFLPLCGLGRQKSPPPPPLPPRDSLAGLVVKASASEVEDPGFESRLRRDFFWVESYQWLQNLALQWLPCQAPGVIGSAPGLVDPVSVYCD